MTAKDTALFLLTLNHLSIFDEKATIKGEFSHPLTGEFSRREFMLFLFMHLRDYNKCVFEQVNAFVEMKSLEKYAKLGYIFIEKPKQRYYFSLTPKGRQVIEYLLARIMANHEDIARLFNFNTFEVLE